MLFRSEHARTHDLRRVIVVIPYLSIIEQNARDYRLIFGADQVLEHHCAVEMDSGKSKATDADDEPSQMLDYERAIENWDVPIVVTTSVQFIESLFAAATGRARKLHNIARSVVIFDEVQTLPAHLLEPTLDVLRTLQKHFGVSVVFCSATQPAFRKSGNLKQGFREDEITEIAPRVNDLFAKLQRVSYRIVPETERWDWNRVAAEMLQRPQALCVVNLRQHAFDLHSALQERLASEVGWALLPVSRASSDQGHGETGKSAYPTKSDDDAVFHLSSAMCPAHRLDVLGLSKNPVANNIKRRLDSDNARPCWVVSTQLIEAGVDIDFPVVLRAMGPLDSIVQAAGRCNRENRLRDASGSPTLGEVIVFRPEDNTLPPGVYRTATDITATLLSQIEADTLATDHKLFERYFDQLYQLVPNDNNIQTERKKLHFRKVAELGRVIQNDTQPVIVPYGKGCNIIEEIRTRAVIKGQPRFGRDDLRKLQRFMVNLHQRDFQRLFTLKAITPLLPNLEIHVLADGWYHSDLGIVIEQHPLEDFLV